jgi:hypothetical protein
VLWKEGRGPAPQGVGATAHKGVVGLRVVGVSVPSVVVAVARLLERVYPRKGGGGECVQAHLRQQHGKGCGWTSNRRRTLVSNLSLGCCRWQGQRQLAFTCQGAVQAGLLHGSWPGVYALSVLLVCPAWERGTPAAQLCCRPGTEWAVSLTSL